MALDDPYIHAWTNLHFEPEDDTFLMELYGNTTLNSSNGQDTFNEDASFDTGWDRSILNIPGPFSVVASNACGTGIISAPHNVIFDENCREYIMIQPRTWPEMLQVTEAAVVDVFDSYHDDGNNYWTIQEVKYWWRQKNEILEILKLPELIQRNRNQDKRYAYYLENFAESYLTRYCYFLENGIWPDTKRVKLPDL